MESWRDDDVARFEAAILPTLLAGERQVARLTNTQLTNARNLTLGTKDRPSPVDLRSVTGDALRGVSPSVVYRRPQKTLNFELSKGKSVTDAVRASSQRLGKLVDIDLQLAKTHTIAKQGQAKSFRRVLSGAENCAKCVIASTQRYRRGNLMPIHPGCDCGVEELHDGGADQVIAPATLKEMHAAIEAEFGASDRAARVIDGLNERSDYLDLIVTREHGETGPTLAWRDQHFTSAAALTF